MLKTIVKAGPITNLTDARYFAAREVAWLSFDFNSGSETYIQPQMMSAIKEWVDSVKFVGEFGMASAAEIRQLTAQLQLDAVQVGMFTDLETLVDLQSPVPVMKEIIIENETTPEQITELLELFQPWVQIFILDFAKNGVTWADLQKSEIFSTAQLRSWCERFPVMFCIDFQKEMLNNFLNALQPLGLCVKGGEEEKTGYKSFDELDEIFDLLEEPEQFER